MVKPAEGDKMTVKEYLKITTVSKMQFYISPNNFENINTIKEKWGNYSYPTTITKWLDQEVEKVFVLSNGTVRFFTH